MVDALKRAGLDPWELRARGLDKPLSPAEFAVALGHIAKRRGFKSARKGKEANTAGDDQKMLKALEGTEEKLARYRTVGAMFARDAEFMTRKRNRDGDYARTVKREHLLKEVGVLFTEQRRLGNVLATDELEHAFCEIAFRQAEPQDSEKLVGICQFEPKEKRAAAMTLPIRWAASSNGVSSRWQCFRPGGGMAGKAVAQIVQPDTKQPGLG